ncbi:hypothetical protein PMI14_04728 [Acidovorax sp. CF316]|nr:hypothetical protein PMI14_04728 [Acidovorax sp. CF316]
MRVPYLVENICILPRHVCYYYVCCFDLLIYSFKHGLGVDLFVNSFGAKSHFIRCFLYAKSINIVKIIFERYENKNKWLSFGHSELLP